MSKDQEVRIWVLFSLLNTFWVYLFFHLTNMRGCIQTEMILRSALLTRRLRLPCVSPTVASADVQTEMPQAVAAMFQFKNHPAYLRSR